MKYKNKNIFWYLIAGSFIIKLFGFIFRKNKKISKIEENFKDFLNEEKKEIEKYENGNKSLGKFCIDSAGIFKDYFIPHNCNNHKPKILRTHSLVVILLIAVSLKLALTGYLFFIYPNQAKMEEQTTNEILRLINEDRKANNLEPLTLNKNLNLAAMAKAENMVAENYFAHYSPEGKKPWDWINRASYPYLFVGENLAMSFTSAHSAHTALMNSPSHKKNILNSRYENIGLAVISGEIDGKKTNILVQLFASQKKPSLVLNTAVDKTAGTTVVNKTPAKPAGESETKVLSSTNIKPKIAETIKTEKHTAVIASNKASSAPTPTASTSESLNLPATTTDSRIAGELISSSTIASLENKLKSDVKDKQYQAFLAEISTLNDNILSPNPDLETIADNQIIYQYPVNDKELTIATIFIKSLKYFYFFMLILMTSALIINIFIRIKIQHKPVIAQTLLAIIFITGLISVKLHFIEYVADKIAIL